MAYITIVSGGAQPVFATDVRNGNPAQTANVAAGGPVNFQGPKLDFFGITANSSSAVSGAGNANGYISQVLQAIQQTTTVAMYQVDPATPALLSIAVYPTCAANVATNLNVGNATVNTTLTWASVTTTGVTANQTVASFTVTGITGVEYLVKGVDATGGKYSVSRVQAVTDATGNVDYSVSTNYLGASTGSLAVNVVGSTIRLQVTPSSSNSTVWTTQYRLI